MSFQQKKKRLDWNSLMAGCAGFTPPATAERETGMEVLRSLFVPLLLFDCFVGVSDKEVKGRDLSKIKVTCACWWWFPHWAALAIYRTSGSHAPKTRSACIKLFLGLVGVTLVHCAAYLKEQARGVRCCAVCWLSCGKPPHDGSIVTSFTV